MSEQQNPRLFDSYDAVTAVFVVLLSALAFEVARNGPAGPIPVHFDLHGQANGWGDRNTIAVLIACVAGFTVLANVVVRITLTRPLAESGLRRTAGLLRGGAVAMGAVVALIFASLALSPAMVDPMGRQRLIMACAWLLIIGVGAVIGKAAPNPYMGVRTYWAFHSRLAWDKANRLAGRIYFLGGLIGLLATPFIDVGHGLNLNIVLLMLVGGGGATAAIYESWRVWKNDPERTV